MTADASALPGIAVRIGRAVNAAVLRPRRGANASKSVSCRLLTSLVTFTVPEALRALLRSHQRLLYGALFSQSAAAMQDLARQPRYFGGELGMLGECFIHGAAS